MQPTSVVWRDLTFLTGPDADFRIIAIDGWENTPPPRYDKQNRTRSHGSHSSPVWADERIVTVEGRSWSETGRDELLRALKARMTFDGGEEPLAINLAGLTLTAGAQFLRCDPVIVREEWGIGRFGWAAQWRCPDPLRYGPAVTTSTGLPSSSGGMVYPIVYGLTYGTAGTPGQLVVSNPGTAPASIVFTVSGPLNGGFEIAAGTQRLTYPVEVPDGQPVTIDTGAGTVTVENGTADRRANLTVADWIQVPAGESLTVSFSSLGAYDAAALLTATVRPAYW